MLPNLDSLVAAFQTFYQSLTDAFTALVTALLTGFGIS